MRLQVGNREIFDEWLSKAIVTEYHSPYFEDRIRTLDVHKLIDLPLTMDKKPIDVLPETTVKEIIFNLTGNEPVTSEGFSQYLYCLSVSYEKLDPSKTLADYGIQEGDLLLLDEVQRYPSLHIAQAKMAIVRDILDFCSSVATMEDIQKLQHDTSSPFRSSDIITSYRTNILDKVRKPSRGRYVQGVLLYTDEDIDLAQYIRYNFSALDKMTGHHLNIYTIEQPAQIKGLYTHDFWKALLEQNAYSFLHMLGWTRFKPYDKSDSYKIAELLGVYPDTLPCIILFGNLTNEDKVVVTITDDLKTFFRGLSSVVSRTIQTLQDSQSQSAFKLNLVLSSSSSGKLFSEFRESFIKNWISWQVETEERKETKITYNFSGRTVFINRPSGQIDFNDFNNDG